MKWETLPSACTGPVRVPLISPSPSETGWMEAPTARDNAFRSPSRFREARQTRRSISRCTSRLSYFPGYDIHNSLPYAEHFNFSIQRELSRSTVLTLSYVGTEGHRLIAQTEANPGDPALCEQLAAQGYTDQSSGTAGCGPNAEQDTFTLGANTIYGTRDSLLNPNTCDGTTGLNSPTGQTLCFGFGNTFTKLVANSVYHSGQMTVQGKAGDVNFLAAYTIAKAIDDSLSLRRTNQLRQCQT